MLLTFVSTGFCRAVGDLTGKEPAGGAGTGAAGPGSSSSPVPPEPTLPGSALPGGVGSDALRRGEQREGSAVGASSTAAEGEERKGWVLACVTAQSPYPTSFYNVRAYGSLQLAQTNRAEVQGTSVRFLQVPGALHHALQPRALMETKNMPDFMSQGLINSLR